MWGSYGSYSSLGSVSEPVDMATTKTLRTHDFATSVCAFPSWPRRYSLSSSEDASRPSSYLSDDDLLADPFDDDSSVGTASPFGGASPYFPSPDAHLRELELQQERQREAKQMLVAEKERRRTQQARKMQAMGKKRSSSAKKSPRSKNAMAPIAEAFE